MRPLGGAPQSIGVIAGVVLSDRTARLHRIDDDAVVNDLERNAVARRRHGAVDRCAVADRPVKGEIGGRVVPDDWLALIERVLGVDRGGQGLVIDFDQLGGVAGGAEAFGDDHRHGVADMAHPLAHYRRVRRQER